MTEPEVRLKPDTTITEPTIPLKPDTRVAEWRRRFTERAEWRLTEHFFRAMFDFGFLSDLASDSFKRVLIGSVGGFVAFGLLLTRMYMTKYAVIWKTGTPEQYRQALLGDDMTIIGLPMLLVAFVTLLVSHSLFPDERDFRILGPLPVRRVIVFRAKLGALLMFTGLFTAAAHISLIPLVLLTSLNPWGDGNVILRLVTWAIASLTASAIAILAITAVVGMLVLALSRSRLQALSTTMRSIVLGSLVVCLPLASQLPTLGASVSSGAAWMALVPPAWFLGLQRLLQGSADARLAQLAVIGIGAAALVAAIVAVTYVVLFRQFERLMLRSAPTSRPWWQRERPLLETRSAPAGRGVFMFATATLGRSQLHQGVLVGLSACGVGLAIIVLTSARLTTSAMIVPFLLMFACGVAVRAALALPIEHRANWIFQVTEDRGTRGDEMRAVDRIVAMYVIGVPIAAAAPLWWVTLRGDALLAAAAVAAIGLVFVHGVLLDWHRIPFTCSYLPGKRFIGHSALIGVAACLLFTLIATGLLRTALSGAQAGLVTVASLVVIGYWLRERRLADWRRTPLMFEDEFPDQPVQLQL
jgi:hypothetical protein